MNLQHILELYFGGPGSGCDPDVAESQGNKCGRPPKGTGTRQDPIRVNSVVEAIKYMEQGKVVEMKDAEAVHTLLDKLAYYILQGKEKVINLCNVTVANTNVFCHDNKEIPRIHMPQTAGKPLPGTAADKLPRNKNGDVDGTEHFMRHLTDLGIKIAVEDTPAAYLRATQSELITRNVIKLMNSDRDISKKPVFTSRDNYIVDGHHRWAAIVGRDVRDGKLGDEDIKTIKVDAPISEVLLIMKEWANKFGIPQIGAK